MSLLLIIRRPPTSTRFPSTTLFRSRRPRARAHDPRGHRRPAGRDETDSAGAGGPLRRRNPLPQPLRSEEHTSELQSRPSLVCRLLLEKTDDTVTNTVTTCTLPSG